MGAPASSTQQPSRDDDELLPDAYADVVGIRTRYIDVGEGRPIVLIHGGEPGSSWWANVWGYNIRALAERFRVVAPDRLFQGYTGNAPGDDDYRIQRVADHLAALLRHLDLKDVTAVGNSRGGLLVMLLAMRHPDLVGRLCVVNSATLAPGYTAFHRAVQENIKGGPDNVRADAEWYSVRTEHITDAYVERTATMLRTPERVASRQAMVRVKAAYLDDLDREKVAVIDWLKAGGNVLPSLIFWGVGDPSTSLADGCALHELLSAGGAPVRLYALNACGHYAFREYAQEFNTVLADFAARSFDTGGIVGRQRKGAGS